ncbi:MAG TPA: ATP-binding protein [Pyrinomonadaceae bacterium]|nr:ATP-binding protein [Pyrinomonadaceae bacterium]
MDQPNPARPYMWAAVALGAAAVLYSALRLPTELLDLRFLLLVVLVCLSSHGAVRIPRVSGRITVSDTLIFLTILLLGGEAAVLLSALEGVYASLRISRKALTLLFNSAVLALSTFLTVWALRALFGDESSAGDVYSAHSLAAVFVMALVQYFANSGLIAAEKSLKLGESLWQTWKNHYLWTSVTYLAGASAASITARLVHGVGFYAVLAAVPVVIIVYFTYRTYLKNFETSEAHVEELSRYVAELKRSEEEREKLLLREQAAREEAEAANRLKDEFLATLSHELRTPLTSIIGWAGLMRAGQVRGEAKAQALETIERNAKVQAQLIDDLLDVSRIISGKLLLDTREVNLGAAVADSILAVRPAADARHIRLTFADESGRAMVAGDPARLQQVAWNLLSNAVKFTPEGGEVRVRLEREGAQARLTVSDTGKGIPAEFLPRVFDRFRQADSTTTRAHGGLGLGLAIVRHLVELHGGTAAAESAGVGLGSTFSVTLPLTPASARAGVGTDHPARRENAAPRRRQPAFALEGLRVLVVDDEDDTRKVITAVIAQHGAEVVACGSAREALDTLRRWRPDVLMSDIGMPGEDGYALIRQVRALPPDRGGRTPAAALTAYAREEDRTRALAAGYQLHVPKPFSAHELIAAVSDLHSYLPDSLQPGEPHPSSPGLTVVV